MCFHDSQCVSTAPSPAPHGNDNKNDDGFSAAGRIRFTCYINTSTQFVSDNVWFHQDNNSLHKDAYLAFFVVSSVMATGAVMSAIRRWRTATNNSTGTQLQRQLTLLIAIWLSLVGRSLALWLQEGSYEAASVISFAIVTATAGWWWGSCAMTMEPLLTLSRGTDNSNNSTRFQLETIKTLLNAVPLVWISADLSLACAMATLSREKDSAFNDLGACRLLIFSMFACAMAGFSVRTATLLLPVLTKAAALEHSSPKRLGGVSDNIARMRRKTIVYIAITFPISIWSVFYLLVGSAPFYFVYHFFYLLAFPLLLTCITMEVQRESSTAGGSRRTRKSSLLPEPPPSPSPQPRGTGGWERKGGSGESTRVGDEAAARKHLQRGQRAEAEGGRGNNNSSQKREQRQRAKGDGRGGGNNNNVTRRTEEEDYSDSEEGDGTGSNLSRLNSLVSITSRFSGSDASFSRRGYNVRRTQDEDVEAITTVQIT